MCHNKLKKPILHRDIKPANVFIKDVCTVKLGDFGLSKILTNESMYAYTNVGTPYYMSPEQINEEKYNHKSDIWSLGCIIYETAALRPPFQAENYLSLAMKIKEGNISRIPAKYSDELQEVIERMIDVDQDKRPSVLELMEHPKVRRRIRETQIKEKDYELEYKAKKITKQENELKKKEKELAQREADLAAREKAVKEIEAQLVERLNMVEEREKKVAEVEKQIAFVSASVWTCTVRPTTIKESAAFIRILERDDCEHSGKPSFRPTPVVQKHRAALRQEQRVVHHL